MMGVEVTVEGGIQRRKNLFEDPLYSSTRHASRLFSLLCKYRIVYVMALMGGHHPPATLINRAIASTSNEPLLVSNQTTLAQFFTYTNAGPLIAQIQAFEWLAPVVTGVQEHTRTWKCLGTSCHGRRSGQCDPDPHCTSANDIEREREWTAFKDCLKFFSRRYAFGIFQVAWEKGDSFRFTGQMWYLAWAVSFRTCYN